MNPITVRLDTPIGDDTAKIAEGEAGNWCVFGEVTGQETIGGLLHTTVTPRRRGSAIAMSAAIERSPRHTRIVGVPA